MDEESHCRARFSASQTGSSYSRREKSWTFSVAVSAATENDERRGSAGEEARFFGRDLNATREKVSTQLRDLSSCENFDWIHSFSSLFLYVCSSFVQLYLITSFSFYFSALFFFIFLRILTFIFSNSQFTLSFSRCISLCAFIQKMFCWFSRILNVTFRMYFFYICWKIIYM